MDVFTRRQLQELIGKQTDLGVSLYMPTHRTGPEIREDPVRFKNLLNTAEGRLKEAGLRTPDAKSLLEPAHKLQTDGLFWRNQSDGLALFAAPDFFRYYRVPVHLDELVIVNRRFHVKPLLPLLQGDGRFYLLAVSQQNVRFFEGTRTQFGELHLSRLPKNLKEALNIDEYVRSLSAHGFTTVGVGGTAGAKEGFVHGHGGSDLDVRKQDELKQFFLRIDRGLKEFFHDEKTPLVFTGVNYLFPIFQETNNYRGLLDEPVNGNPDGLKASELHKKAWGVVEPHFQKNIRAALENYGQWCGTGRTSHDPKEVVSAAHEGRVETLFVTRDKQLWGVPNGRDGSFKLRDEPGPETEDLLDHAAVHTLMHHGTVYALDDSQMPDGELIAGLFRYAPGGQ